MQDLAGWIGPQLVDQIDDFEKPGASTITDTGPAMGMGMAR